MPPARGYTADDSATIDLDKPHFGQLFLSIAQAYAAPVTQFGENGAMPLPGLKV